jgi:stage V sporulation protein K
MTIFSDISNPFNASNFHEDVFVIKKLFSKKSNDHLINALELLSNAFKNDKIDGALDKINELYDSKVVDKNCDLIYAHFKYFVIEHYARKHLYFLSQLKTLFLVNSVKENSECNLAILNKYVDDILSDHEIDDAELNLSRILCKTFEVELTEFTSVLSHKIMLIQNDMINGLFIDKEKKIQLIKKYYKILNEFNHKYDTEKAYKFINKYNFYCFKNNDKLTGLNLNIGLGSLSNFELFNVFDVKYGKIKKTGGSMSVELFNGKLYNYGAAYLLVKINEITGYFTGESTVLMFNEIKEYGIGSFNNTNEKYFWYKLKGERNSHIISGIQDNEVEEYIAQFNKLIDNPSLSNSNSTNTKITTQNNSTSTSVNNTESRNKIINEDCLNELNSLIGLENVKVQINSLVNLIKAQELRKNKNLKVVNVSLHSVFSGPPGTGKTTVARLYAGILKELGILKKGHLIEVDRSELVAGYLGQTAIKTEEVINRAIDGVLFIDEAYSLTSSSSDSFGEEAVNVLLKRMEDERDRLVVIVAGYTNEMESFINSNPGLQSRFTRYIEFENYSAMELTEIFESLVKKNEYKIDELAKEKLQKHFTFILSSGKEDFGNGRYVRNLFEKVIQEHANQIVSISNPSDDELILITETQINV